jgi:hypothetical protein
MFSARAIFEEIFDHDEAFQLFCSIAARGEGQGGWENGRIAALVPGSQAELAPKISRHGADEDKHRRIFNALLRKRGLHPVSAPADTDYTMRLENAGIRLAHARLQAEEKLTETDIVAYLAHSRVTEQRASEQMRALRKYVGSQRDQPWPFGFKKSCTRKRWSSADGAAAATNASTRPQRAARQPAHRSRRGHTPAPRAADDRPRPRRPAVAYPHRIRLG